MIITAPVTDYIRASVLTTLNDIVIRGAAIPARLAEADWRGVHIGTDTRNAGGAQVIAGVGFTSRMVIFLTADNNFANPDWSIGFDNGTVHICMNVSMGQANIDVTAVYSLTIQSGAINRLRGTITAIGADGFTITWDLLGAQTVDFIYLCLP